MRVVLSLYVFWIAACAYRLLALAHAHQLTHRDASQFSILFPLLVASVGFVTWLFSSGSKLLKAHVFQYAVIVLAVGVVLSTVVIYAPHASVSADTASSDSGQQEK
ncbi:MAG: hypothetical protein ABR910_02550 [Acidobacteriaceae bacterium]|jgi:hypothetical protein